MSNDQGVPLNSATITFHGDFFVADFTLVNDSKARVIVGDGEGWERCLVDAPEADMRPALGRAARALASALIDAEFGDQAETEAS